MMERKISQPTFPAIYLLHGKGGWPGGSVSQLEALLQPAFPNLSYIRPSLPHGKEHGEQPAEQSLKFLQKLATAEGALLIGISMGGLVAAKLQEDGRADLHVICISSPTWADGVALERRMERRVALYSSADEVILGRTSEWPQLAEAYDLPWLTHDTDVHKQPLAELISAYIGRRDLATASQHLVDR